MKRLPFRWKLILFIVLICGVSLSLAFAGLYFYEDREFNTEVQRRVENSRRLMVENLVSRLHRGISDAQRRWRMPRWRAGGESNA